MSLDELRKILHEDAPFIVHLASGRQFRVPHTDHAALTINNSSLIISDVTGGIELIRLPSIESITLEKKPAA